MVDVAAAIRWVARPPLRQPFLVVAYSGWNDAGEAATTAVRLLRETLDAAPAATIDPDVFFNFQAQRPMVHLESGTTRRIEWPANEFHTASTAADHDLIVGLGVEPHLQWRAFCAGVLSVAAGLDASMVISLGALLADVPHTRPVRITGTAADAELVERLGFQRSRYEGPTGIVGVLHDACRNAGIPSASLWATVPHYVSATPNPVAALALLEAFGRLSGVHVPLDELRDDVGEFTRHVDEAMVEDDEVVAYVRELERRVDGEDEDTDGDVPLVTGRIPSGDELAAELERFLRGES